jgi:hypothetical protein
MAIKASDCDTFVLLLVDTDAAVAYLIDNRSGEGSRSEGTSSLATRCGKGSNLCWRAKTIVPCGGATISTFSIGNSNAWGFSGQPQSAPDLLGALTGQAQNAITATSYPMSVSVQLPTGSFVTPSVTPQIAVQGPPGQPRAQLRSTEEFVVPSSTAQGVRCPQTIILIAVDADRFRASTGASGVYLVDNRLSIGSVNECSPRLGTFCNAGDFVAFGVVSIHPYDGYTVTIDSVDISAGRIFPERYAPRISIPTWWSGAQGSLWMGRAVIQGEQTYALTLHVDDGISPFSATMKTALITCR